MFCFVDLTDERSFRDLSKPVGALTEERLQRLHVSFCVLRAVNGTSVKIALVIVLVKSVLEKSENSLRASGQELDLCRIN